MEIKFNSERFKEARLYRKCTVETIASMLGISKQAVSKYEKENASIPSPENILKIADFLQFPVEYFFQPSLPQSNEATYYRKKQMARVSDFEEQRIKTEFLKQLYTMLNNEVDFPELHIVEKQPNESIRDVAMRLRQKWDLGLNPIDDLQKVMERNGIIVSALKMNEQIDAYSTFVNGRPIVVTNNKTKTQARTFFSIAHELGHIMLHEWEGNIADLAKTDKNTYDKIEKEANKFAAEFLLPYSVIRQELSLYPTSIRYYHILKDKWNVSVQALLYRAMDLGIISEGQYLYVLRSIPNRKQEEDDVDYRFNGGMLQRAIHILREDYLDELFRCINMLSPRLSLKEIEKLLCLKDDFLTSAVVKNMSEPVVSRKVLS